MKYEELIKYVDGGKITTAMTLANPYIGKAEFTLNGVRVVAQFHIGSDGLYSPEISLEDLLKLAGKITPQSDDNEGANTPDKESL